MQEVPRGRSKREQASEQPPAAGEGLRPNASAGSHTEAVKNIVGATLSLVGPAFLAQLVVHAASEMGVTLVFVLEALEGGHSRVAASSDKQLLPPDLTASFSGSPMERVRAISNVYFCGDNAAKQFPTDPCLSDHGVRSFVGVPLMSSDGAYLGQIAVMSRDPIRDGLAVEATLRALAPRVAGELERRRVELRLRESEELFRLLIEHAEDLVYRFALEPAPHFQYISPSSTKMTGYAPEELYADWRIAQKMIHPDDYEFVFGQEIRAQARKATTRWFHRDGRIVYGEFVAIPLFGDDGQLIALEGIVRDVTDRARLEEELRNAEARQRAVIEALPDMVFRLDRAGVYREYIPAEGEQTYAEPESFIGRNVAEVMPEDLAVATLRAIHDALDKRERQTMAYSLVMDDVERLYEARIVPTSQDEVLAFVRERTAEVQLQREAQRREERDVLEGKVERQIARRNPYDLTFREFTILHHVAAGRADKEIAEELGISPFTVNKHVASILSKMDAPSRTAAGVRAVREGLLE